MIFCSSCADVVSLKCSCIHDWLLAGILMIPLFCQWSGQVRDRWSWSPSWVQKNNFMGTHCVRKCCFAVISFVPKYFSSTNQSPTASSSEDERGWLCVCVMVADLCFLFTLTQNACVAIKWSTGSRFVVWNQRKAFKERPCRVGDGEFSTAFWNTTILFRLGVLWVVDVLWPRTQSNS